MIAHKGRLRKETEGRPTLKILIPKAKSKQVHSLIGTVKLMS